MIQLVFSLVFSKVSNANVNSTATEETLVSSHEDRESLVLIKKIFLSASNSEPETSAKNDTAKSQKSTHSSLLYCLFSSISTDSRESIEILLQELLFRFVQNDCFSKSEKIKLFNEKTLTALTKLYEWTDVASGEASATKKREKLGETEQPESQTLIVREMINEFLKILFCSTRHGINFYDRTLNIDQSNKNFNHLIFSVIINIQRPSVNSKASVKSSASCKANDVALKTNDMIDELLLKTLKVCPDLIQRFLKVKYKKVNVFSINA